VVAGVTSPRRLVAESYDRAAPGFAGAADQHVYRLLALPLVDAVARFGDTSVGPVLDVAAGTGAVGRHFAQVVAADLSIEQLRRNRAPRRVRADGEFLPFRAGSFTAAVCGFGINHVADPLALVGEMARVAAVVGVSTWRRPEVPYAPKQAVFDLLARRSGRARSKAGELLDRYTEAVGSADAVAGLLHAAGLRAEVALVEVEIPWPGVDAYLEYRLSMPTSPEVLADCGLRAELRDALQSLPPESLAWRPGVIVAVGRP
jgi:ubiquinone/menaquinone biosynthesis C-methylase UbiE